MRYATVADLLDLTRGAADELAGLSSAEARRLLFADDPRGLLDLADSFALVARDGERVRLARSLDRPLRYFLAKQEAGPLLVVADRIDAIRDALAARGLDGQFHPSYTRMVPAHYVTEIRLVGCPDPNPTHRRFFDPPRGVLPADLDAIGRAYVGALAAEVRAWLARLPAREPIGVAFSGGLDSGAVLLALHHELLAAGQSAARLKAFTLAVDGGGEDLAQARAFLRAADLDYLHEPVEMPAAAVDPLAAVAVIEDYKSLDVECAAVALALCRGVRERYPDWRLLVDGDGGDENLKDYPIEENAELTIRSVVSNRMLYQEGWGVEAVKHSLTYSGGYGRGCVRTWAPLRRFGFAGFSPFTRPALVAVAEAIPFDELARGSHAALYALKGEVLGRGVRQVLGRELPRFPKRRFQRGALPAERFDAAFAGDEQRYRRHFLALHEAAGA
jgi:asparagine synthase (glutamine-hydrolysing)